MWDNVNSVYDNEQDSNGNLDSPAAGCNINIYYSKKKKF